VNDIPSSKSYSVEINTRCSLKRQRCLCPHMKAYRRSRGLAPLILNFGTGWRWVVKFTNQLLYPPPPVKEPVDPLNYALLLPRIEPRIVRPVDQSLYDYAVC
jgi:hypothetical protein